MAKTFTLLCSSLHIRNRLSRHLYREIIVVDGKLGKRKHGKLNFAFFLRVCFARRANLAAEK